MIRNSSLYCWRYADRPMNAGEVVLAESNLNEAVLLEALNTSGLAEFNLHMPIAESTLQIFAIYPKVFIRPVAEQGRATS